MTTILLTHTPEMRAQYYGPRALAALQALAPVRLNESPQPLDSRALAEAAKGCALVVTDRQTAVPAAFFADAPDAVAVLRVAVDIRNIDVAAASTAGILVTQATPGFATSVAELAVGFMVDLARHITTTTSEYRAGLEPGVRMGRQLKGSVLGILGYGVIGQELGRIAVALGMRVLACDPFRAIDHEGVEQVGFDELLAEADFVVCLVVATPETENLMNADAFARMKRRAFFLNLSRGNLVDEAALARALDSGFIAGAALDVGRAADQKPSLALAGRLDVIATPHTAGLTPEAIEHQAFDTVEQARSLLAGELPRGAVNAPAASRLARLPGFAGR